MNFKEIKELIKLVSEREIDELQIERAGIKITIRKNAAVPKALEHGRPAPVVPLPQETTPAATGALVSSPVAERELHLVKSPLVGTFYSAPSPGSDPFVHIGDQVEVGTVLCVVEAMKLMNEIESDMAGEVAQILVDSGQPVEYGEPLFGIRVRR
ncbi:MAG: acetyl-CoA carboxylase biotin carboxyl carrier protein [Acidobacteria bacterium]|nr:acetyl-CoA carboxylase biotin carboxyl carrier protein [Acidobacteriota bacterium]